MAHRLLEMATVLAGTAAVCSVLERVAGFAMVSLSHQNTAFFSWYRFVDTIKMLNFSSDLFGHCTLPLGFFKKKEIID